MMKRYFVLLTFWMLFISVGNAQVIPNGVYEIRYASAPSYAISLYEGTVVSGSNVVLYSCTGANTQKWIVTNSADGSISLNNFANTQYAIDLDHGKAANGTNVLLWSSDNRINQRWIPERKGESFILRSAVNTNYVINLDNNTAENNRNIQLWESNNSYSQLWQFVRINAQEKEVYIPKDILEQDFENPESNWCRQRMRLTPNFTILWEKGFGNDPSHAPDLDGKNMCVDLDALAEHAEEIYDMYRNKMKFVGDYSKCDIYRMLIFLKYNNDNTAWGGSRDNTIGAVTQICPEHIRRSWGMLAHELGHCFQQQIGCDKIPHEYFGHKHGFCELCSQWGLWNYNNNWVGDEWYHLNYYIANTHKPFFHRELCGRAPYILEYWSEKYGITFIGKLYREGRQNEDVVTVFKRMKNMGQKEFCDEVFDAFCHTVNLDFKLNWQGNRDLGLKFGIDIPDSGESYWQVPAEYCPETYGYNAINLAIPSPGQTVTVNFEGIIPQAPYKCSHPEKAGWRYGIVMVDDEGRSHYGQKSSSAVGGVSFTAPYNTGIKKLWLIVMGAPTLHWDVVDDENATDAQWPYRIRVVCDDNYEVPTEITIKNAGELRQMVETDSRINTAVSLKINGMINGTDILKLRELAGRDYDGGTTNGRLRYLDLSNVNIVDGGARYSNDVELDDLGTKADVFPDHSFQNTRIRKVILPMSTKSIGRYAFGGCKELEEVSYGDHIEKIDYAAFTYSNLEEVFIGDGVESMEACSFYQMRNLKKIFVGSNLKTIPWKTFYECQNLKEIILGENLQRIEQEAFAGCSQLRSIICRNNLPYDIAENSFSDVCYDKAVVYVPKGSAHLYRQLAGWRNFKTIIELDSSDINKLMNSYKLKGTERWFDLNGRQLNTKPTQKNVYINKGHKVLIKR